VAEVAHENSCCSLLRRVSLLREDLKLEAVKDTTPAVFSVLRIPGLPKDWLILS
jgi:hypothetical protein